jgi:hypothetical protein
MHSWKSSCNGGDRRMLSPKEQALALPPARLPLAFVRRRKPLIILEVLRVMLLRHIAREGLPAALAGEAHDHSGSWHTATDVWKRDSRASIAAGFPVNELPTLLTIPSIRAAFEGLVTGLPLLRDEEGGAPEGSLSRAFS